MFISSAFSAFVSVIIKPFLMGTTHKRSTKYDCLTLCNGALVGMVAISGVVDGVENWGAVIIGAISAVWYVLTVLLLDFFHIDDPLEVVPVHLAGGIWGLWATGFFFTTRGALFAGTVQ